MLLVTPAKCVCKVGSKYVGPVAQMKFVTVIKKTVGILISSKTPPMPRHTDVSVMG